MCVMHAAKTVTTASMVCCARIAAYSVCDVEVGVILEKPELPTLLQVSTMMS